MKVYLLRHGESEHLLDNWKRPVTGKEFITLMKKWQDSHLTPNGEKEIFSRIETLKDKYDLIFCSPLSRTVQSAIIVNCEQKIIEKLPILQEIYISPPLCFLNLKFSIRTWMFLCAIKSIFTGQMFSFILEAKKLFKKLALSRQNILLISHEARILSILAYAKLSPFWMVNKINFKPAGISIIESGKLLN